MPRRIPFPNLRQNKYQRTTDKFIKANNKLYEQAKKFIALLPQNWKAKNHRETVISIFLARSIENLKSVEILTKQGYIAQAASLTANSIEIFLEAKKVSSENQAATQWLNHTQDKLCWPITGKNGLCQRLGLKKIEKHYQLLSSIKHIQKKTNFNISRQNSIIISPIYDADKAIQILGYNISSAGDAIRECAKILKKPIKKRLYKNWKQELLTIQTEIKQFFSQWRETLTNKERK